MSGVLWVARSMGLLGELPPRKVTQKILIPLGLPPRPAPINAAAWAAHFAFGAAAGSAFGALPRRWTTPSAGALFGLGVWTASYVGWLPALRLMPPPSKDRPGRPTVMALAHVVYGATLGAALREQAIKKAATEPDAIRSPKASAKARAASTARSP